MAEPREVPPEARAAVDRFTEQVRKAFGARLLSVVLYGSAASGDYVHGRSDLNLALVLETVALEDLERCRPFLDGWRKDGIALPLLLTPTDIQRSADIFPVEFLDICEYHVLLHGADFFADLDIDPRYLRFQVEHELKAKILSLREAYLGGLDRGTPEALVEELFETSVPSVIALGRNLLRASGQRPPTRRRDAPAALERAFGLSLPVLADLAQRRASRAPLAAGDDPRARFGRYLEEVESLARVADSLGDPAAWRGERPGGGAGPCA